MILKAPGMTPEEVETRVDYAARNGAAWNSTTDHSAARRRSTRLADITLDFEDGTDIYWARQQVAERLAGVRDESSVQRYRRTGARIDAAVRRFHVHH